MLSHPMEFELHLDKDIWNHINVNMFVPMTVDSSRNVVKSKRNINVASMLTTPHPLMGIYLLQRYSSNNLHPSLDLLWIINCYIATLSDWEKWLWVMTNTQCKSCRRPTGSSTSTFLHTKSYRSIITICGELKYIHWQDGSLLVEVSRGVCDSVLSEVLGAPVSCTPHATFNQCRGWYSLRATPILRGKPSGGI
ncbi:hypothetical protein Hamer_G031685, partial [Homarus americanus]